VVKLSGSFWAQLFITPFDFPYKPVNKAAKLGEVFGQAV
jgi:hypothetical protein